MCFSTSTKKYHKKCYAKSFIEKTKQKTAAEIIPSKGNKIHIKNNTNRRKNSTDLQKDDDFYFSMNKFFF